MKGINGRISITLALGFGVIGALALLWVLSGSIQVARAGDLTVCPTGPPTCDYDTIQAAVDAANDGDVVKVATGVYTGVSAREAVTQVVYVSKTVTIRGGYTTAFADPPDPDAKPTTRDAQGQGRVLYITGDISPKVEGLRITGGHASQSGGSNRGKRGQGPAQRVIVTSLRTSVLVFWDAITCRHHLLAGPLLLSLARSSVIVR